MSGTDTQPRQGRTWVDWLVIGLATAIIIPFAAVARAPQIVVAWGWAAVFVLVMLAAMIGCGVALWRTTRFS